MITANSSDLMRQAWKTADDYKRYARECIGDQLGDGYAAKYPELIGAFIQAAAIDCGAAVTGPAQPLASGRASLRHR